MNIQEYFDIEDERKNEDDETEYLVNGEWHTIENLEEMASEDEYWIKWSSDLAKLDEE